jgi:hypothetical protein
MTIAQHVARVAFERETSAGERDFVMFAKALVAGMGDRGRAAELATAWGASPRIVSILKAAVSANVLADLAPYQLIASAFTESLRNFGLFDAMLADGFVRAGFNSVLGLVTTGATGETPVEASPKLISALALGANQTLLPKKSTAIVAISDELARSAAAENLIGNELKNACAVAVDTAFLTVALVGVSGQASAGSSLANITTDLAYLASTVSTSARSRLYFATTPTLCRKLAFKSDTVGARAFPQLGPLGGQIANVPVIISDAITAGDLLLFDAAGLAAAADPAIMLDFSSQADIQLSTTSDSPPTAATVLQSLWQSNLRGLRAERYWAAVRLRTSAIARVTGANY